MDFDVAARELGVPHRFGPRDDFAFDQDHGFGAELLRGGDDVGGRPTRSKDDLHEPIAVAQIDENDTPEIPTAVDPPTQTDPLPHVLFSQRAGMVGSQGCLNDIPLRFYAAPPLSASQMIR